ncbi:MAG: malto-oligosyltrehalose trehalohydrolase [Gammaproteobacteria bacterium]
MPFGSEIQHDGRARFRLWAPAAKQVDLYWRSADEETDIAMHDVGGGWFCLVTAVTGTAIDYGFRIDTDPVLLPDPASRYQPYDVHGLSRLVDPAAWDWQDAAWRGRPWEETVVYELHVGTFTPAGDFQGILGKLDYLAALGITAIQLMPVADFPGRRNWGYDGVLPYAPDSRYGTPDDLKRLVQTAHAKGLMVFLDVVYNHFGPEGNYLHRYAPQFFSARHSTPWGDAINFDAEGSDVVRQFFIHNALYWLEEFHFDGLRFDAVHAVCDDSEPSIWEQLAQAVDAGPGAARPIHLVLENDRNAAHLLRRYGRNQAYRAQWNDDFHHALHVLLSGEIQGYYRDYAQAPLQHFSRCLCEGFAYQGEASAYRGGKPRGEPSGHLPPTAFVDFLQNHDQIGNRLGGERLTRLTSAAALRAATELLLLSPAPPLLFMGQEWGSEQPFYYFCDFEPQLNAAVVQGRHKEFEILATLTSDAFPSPDMTSTFEQCRLDWNDLDAAAHQAWFSLHCDLLKLRHLHIIPRLRAIHGGNARCRLHGTNVVQVEWLLGDASLLTLLANLSAEYGTPVSQPLGIPLYASQALSPAAGRQYTLPPWTVAWFIQTPGIPP